MRAQLSGRGPHTCHLDLREHHLKALHQSGKQRRTANEPPKRCIIQDSGVDGMRCWAWYGMRKCSDIHERNSPQICGGYSRHHGPQGCKCRGCTACTHCKHGNGIQFATSHESNQGNTRHVNPEPYCSSYEPQESSSSLGANRPRSAFYVR